MKKLLVSLVSLFLVAGCGPTSVKKLEQTHGAQPLSPERVLELVENNTLFIHAFDEDSYLYFDTSGRLFGRDINNNSDDGQWDVSEEGELCVRMSKWWYGDLSCYQVLESGGHYYLAMESGLLRYKAEQLPGDPHHLYKPPKKKRRSYRHSRRSYRRQRRGRASAPPPRAQEPAAAGPDEATQAVVEENRYPPSKEQQDIGTTIKWMARNCPGCNLANSDLRKADLVAAELAGANLRGANLRMANLRRANLRGANLERADLSHANLPGANLQHAILRDADLTGANLIHADLSCADLRGARLDGALLEGMRGFSRK